MSWKLIEALVTAIDADVTLTDTYFGGQPATYNGRAPQDKPMSYVVIGGGSEDEVEASFDAARNESRELIHIWTPGVDQEGGDGFRTAYRIYDELKRILHRTKLTVEGRLFVRGRLRRVTAMIDPDDKSAHLIAEYRAVIQ